MMFLGAAAGALVLFALIAATRPAAYRVVRKLELAAPPGAVFDVLTDPRRFSSVLVFFGSPLEADPKLEKTFEGQSFAWKGKDAGEGKLTITESIRAQRVGLALEFFKPMASKATWAFTLEPTPTGSSVTWTMDGHHNFLGKAAGLLMNMDKALGADLEKGLSRLGTAAEGR